MKIGLYGGLANNCYLFAKALHQAGYDAMFIRDRNDRYAFSQPVWEDAEFVMSYEDVAVSSSLKSDDWTNIEAKQKWLPPVWLVDPPAAHSEPNYFGALPAWLRSLARRYVNQNRYRLGVVVTMQDCDLLLVCGIEASILALVSGRPYIIWPHGGDIRMAAGLAAPPRNIRARVSFEVQKALLIAAYDRAAYVGTHDPRGLGGSAGDVRKALRRTSLVHLPIPLSCGIRASKVERRSRLKALCQRLDLPCLEADAIGLVPSRVDFSWKGHDLLLGALRRAAGRERLHLIFSGWGKDYDRAKAYVTHHGLEEQVTFLPFSLSKPLLAEFFSLVDFAVDQFGFMGTYGTALVEALAAGCPTLMWIDETAFNARGWLAPPVMNAQHERDIVDCLERVASGAIDLEEVSQRSLAWVRRVHAPEVVLPVLISYFVQMETTNQGTA